MATPAAGIDAARFRRCCAIAGLLFLLISQFGKLVYYDHKHLTTYQDFPQYYMGGQIARAGAWDSLYPIPNLGTSANPGFIEDSTMRPEYAAIAQRTGIGQAVRYMQPPPLALLLWPLAWLPAHVCFYLWTGLLCFAAWGIGLQAARMYELCAGDTGPGASWLAARASGLIILLVCLSPQAHRWIRVSNMSVLIGWLIGCATLSLVRGRDVAGAVSLFVGAIAKYALLALGPLYLAMRRWRAIVICAVLGVAMLAASVAVMGTGPYQTFVHEIMPTLGRSSPVIENQSLPATVMHLSGVMTLSLSAKIALGLTQWGFFLLIMVMIFAAAQSYWQRPVNVIGAALALVAWMLLFSPMCWEHYFAYLAPFWGFLIYQATRSWLRCVGTVLAIGLCYLPISLIRGMPLPHAVLLSHLCWALVATLLVAVWVMIRDRDAAT